MERVKSSFCDTCQEQRRFTKKTPNHALHIVATVLTAGLWFFPYLFISFTAQRDYTCVQCGTRLKGKVEQWADRKRAEADAQPKKSFRDSFREGWDESKAKGEAKQRKG